MIEFILKKPYTCQFGTIQEGRSIRVMRYNNTQIVYLDGGVVEPGYASIILKLVEDKKLHEEYLSDHEVLRNKV